MLLSLTSPELGFYAPSCAEQQALYSPVFPVIHLKAEVKGNYLSKEAKGLFTREARRSRWQS